MTSAPTTGLGSTPPDGWESEVGHSEVVDSEVVVERGAAVVPFASLTLADVARAGGKGANLGELTRAGVPVPGGSVVLADAYLRAMEAAGVRDELRARFAEATAQVDDPAALSAAANGLRDLVRAAGMPAGLRTEILEAYHALGDDVAVAVRSSATGEDTAGTSFAGMHETFANVIGDDAVIESVVACWCSLYGERVIAYRASRGLVDEPAIAVVLQELVPAERSGVMFTADPSTSDATRIVIEAAFGLGEVVVGGQVEPDTYVVAKDGMRLERSRIGAKAFRLEPDPGGRVRRVDLDATESRRQVLEPTEVVALAELGLRIESHYGEPQDVEWVIAGGRTAVVQARPITSLSPPAHAPAAAVLVRGLAASTGRASGRVRVLRSPAEGSRLASGEVLVAPMTNPDWVPTIRRAAAVVTDGGGMTCHAAIVARELGVPCVVGARDATTTLHDGDLVTVAGDEGAVYAGDVTTPQASRSELRAAAATVLPPSSEALATKIYVNLAMADHADEVAAMAVDGVGLLRAEFLLTEALGGMHPRQLLATGGREEFLDRMSSSLLRITRPFAPRPVVYRTIDFRSNEFRGLAGGDRFEPVESNPMIGYRGCYRYVREPDLFELELELLARVRDETANLHLMIPFVRTAWELEACLEMVDRSPLGRQRGLHRWVMAEVPSVVYRIPEYAAMGIDGVSIGSNDLTQLMLGVDRDSETCAELFDESDAAVLDAIGGIIRRSQDAGLTTSLCGQAPSNRPDFADHLVRLGIDSISVDPSAVGRTRRVVAASERRVLLDVARRSQ
jgi:pyruvate,water dikinase